MLSLALSLKIEVKFRATQAAWRITETRNGEGICRILVGQNVAICGVPKRVILVFVNHRIFNTGKSFHRAVSTTCGR